MSRHGLSLINVLSDNTIRCINTDLITFIKREIIQSHIYSVMMIPRSQPVTQSSSCQILLSNHDIRCGFYDTKTRSNL